MKPEPTPIAELEKLLGIDQNALELSLLVQPEAYYRVAKALVHETSRRDAAKQLLAETESRVDLEIRDAWESNERIREGEVESQKRLDKRVNTALLQLSKLTQSVNELTALKEAFQQRSYVLKDLCALYIANYYGGDIEPNVAKQLKGHSAQENKDRMMLERQKRRRESNAP